MVAGAPAYAHTGGRPLDAERALVFVHGAAMDHTVWALQSRYFAHRGWGVLALDLPGHGRSGGAAHDSIDAYADWLVAVLDAAELSRAALVGHSMGSLIALAAAAMAPDRVSALALLGAAAPMRVHPDLIALAEADDPRAVEQIVAWAYGRDAQLGGHRAPGLWFTGGGRQLLCDSAPGVLAGDLRACDAFEAPGVAARTLVLCGADDRMTPPKTARPLLDALPDARLTVLDGAGHMMMLEAPEATRAALRDFLEGRQ